VRAGRAAEDIGASEVPWVGCCSPDLPLVHQPTLSVEICGVLHIPKSGPSSKYAVLLAWHVGQETVSSFS